MLSVFAPICLEVSPVDPEVSRSFSPFSSPDLDLVHRQVMASTGRSPGTLSRKCLFRLTAEMGNEDGLFGFFFISQLRLRCLS